MEKEMHADKLCKALTRIGRLPKTFKVEHVTTQTDTVTGKEHKDKNISNHSLISVVLNGRSYTVDFEKFKGYVKKLGKEPIILSPKTNALEICHKTGEFVFFDIDATAAAVMDFDTMEIAINPEVMPNG